MHVVLQNVAKRVKRSQQTPAYRLFFVPTTVQVQQMFTMSQMDIERVGTPTCGDEELDQQMRNEWVSVKLTAVQMTEMIAKGAQLMFNDLDAPIRLYEDIVTHLRSWYYAFDKDPNLTTAPVDDLRQLDDLGSQLHKYAIRKLKRTADKEGYAAFLAARRGSQSVSRAIMNKGTGQLKKPGEQAYVTLAESIAEKLYNRQKQYGIKPQ